MKMKTSRPRTLGSLVAVLCLIMLVGCGEDEEDEAAVRPDDPCASKGSVSGVQGRVVTPSCSMFVPSPTVTLLDGLQFEVATTEGDVFGEFSFSGVEDGNYIITVKKGPYKGPATPMPFTVNGGKSDYQLVKVDTQ